MTDLTPATIAISFVITWVVGLVPPLLIRYVFIKRRISKWPAIGLCALFLVLNMAFFIAIGSQSEAHSALVLVAFVSYWILRLKPSEHQMRSHSSETTSNKIKTKDKDYIRCSNCDFEQWVGYEKCQKCGTQLK